jgi:hypothetical protein
MALFIALGQVVSSGDFTPSRALEGRSRLAPDEPVKRDGMGAGILIGESGKEQSWLQSLVHGQFLPPHSAFESQSQKASGKFHVQRDKCYEQM